MDREAISGLEHCYVTTTGRKTGRPHTIEIWFALVGDSIHLMSGNGERSDWVRNIREHPTVGLRLGDHDFIAHARIIDRSTDEDAAARKALLEKYSPRTDDDLSGWQREALVISIDLPAAD